MSVTTAYSCLLSFVTLVSSLETIQVPGVREKVCYGTDNGLSYTVDPNYPSQVRARYQGCTFVRGNLELTHGNPSDNVTLDMSFLSSIEVVTGYVLIALIRQAQTIPLTNLKVIRGDQTILLRGKELALAVVLNESPDDASARMGLEELQMPALQEISNGSVLFFRNSFLKFVDTVDWSMILLKDDASVEFDNSIPQYDSECSPECETDGVRRCWGQGADMCQQVSTQVCHPRCEGRCYGRSAFQCCHSQCSLGCWGHRKSECMMCKNFFHETGCVTSCPEHTYPVGRYCDPY